jgi:hypothetical protein
VPASPAVVFDGRIDDAIKLLDEDELRRTAQEEKGKAPMPSRPGLVAQGLPLYTDVSF